MTLSEVEGGIISGFRILQGNAGDEAQLRATLEDHLRLFGKVPELVAADRNVHSKENERVAKQMGVKKVCLPKAGKKSTEREEHERQGWFKRARRFRAGIEGRISVMKRRGYLGRCRDRGEEGFGRWVGGADGEPGYHSPNIGGSMILRSQTETREGVATYGRLSPISHQKLSNAKLLGATLRGADLTSALLGKANLEATHFDRLDILMDEEDRVRLDVTSSELIRTNLVDADLSGTILKRADLLGTKINDQQLASSGSLEGATMPNGQKYEDWLKDKEGREEDG